CRVLKLHERTSHILVVILTARAYRLSTFQGLNLGANAYFTKPFDRDELRVRVHQGERIINLERRLAEQSRSV
ncbi:MAG: hypothetical protein M3Y28_11235, partial [Armatimonadota bacterium]|nr:hypothetical protein [Armatimonadota bacterium]